MNKIKKSLSVLLSLVMLFTTLCFFVLPETGIKANAREEVQGGYSESVNPVQFSAASNTLKVDVNNVSTTVKAKITNSDYRVKINSITAEMPYESGEALTVSYTAGTVVTGETSFTVTGKIPATANSVVRYTFEYDVETADGKITLYRNLTGYAYGVLTAYDKKEASTSGERASYDESDNCWICRQNDLVNFEWDGLYFPNAKYFLYTTDVNVAWQAKSYDLGGKHNCTLNISPSVSISESGISTSSIYYDPPNYSTEQRSSGDWFKINWSTLKSGYYNFTYNLNMQNCGHSTQIKSEFSGGVEIYHLNTTNTDAGMSERATAEYYANLTRGVTGDGNMNYYVQKNRYTTASWNNFLSTLDMAYQVAYAQEWESEGFKMACNNASTAYTNLYSAVKALVPAQSSVSYDSLFNLYDWHNSFKSSSLNDPSKGNIFISAEDGTINIKSNAGVTDLYTIFEDSGKLTENLYATQLEPDSNYMFLYKVQDGSTGSYQTMVFPYNEDGSKSTFAGRGWADIQDMGNTAGWRTVTFSTGSAVTMATVRFGVTSENANVTFSDIHLVKIPEGESASSYAEYLKDISYPSAVKIVNVGDGKYGALAAPTRGNYDFVGWFFADGTVFNPDSEISDNSISVFSKWTPKKSVLTFDNLFNFAEWKEAGITGNRGVISDITDTGFTLTATAANTDDAYTNWTPSIAVQPNTTYRFEADIDFDNSVGGGANDIFVHMKTADGAVDTDYLREDGTVNGTEYYNTSGKNYIQFTTSADTASVSFRFDANNEGNVLKVNNIRLLANGVSYVPSQVVTYGETYNLPTPTRPGYTFAGWRDSANALYKTGDTVKITEDKFLHSTWTPTPYTITLRDSITGEETTHTYTIEDTAFTLPSADEMQKVSYTFTGWEVTSNSGGNWTVGTKADGTLNKNYGNVTITAKYDEIYYTIKWVDWNGNLLKEEQVRYGVMPTKPDTDPVKEGDAQYSYEFTGWGEITKAYEDKTYTAQYTQSVNKYTVTWENDDGTVLETDSNVEYGSRKYEYNGTTPVKNATAEYTYTFDGWTIKGDTSGKVYTSQELKVVDIFGNVTYVAHFSATKNKYTVTWKDHNGNNISSEELEYGTAVTPAELSERTDPTGMYTYTFAGWENVATHEKVTDFAGMTVTGNVTYQATYTQTKNQYTVTFKYKDAKGADKTYTVTVDHGTLYSSITLPDYAQYYWTEADVAVTEDANQAFFHTHYKANWGTTPETITQAAVFTATYSKVENVQMDVQKYDPGDCINNGENTQICHDCGYIYSKVIEAPGHHDLEEISDTANCLDDGIKTFKCKKCDYTETEDSFAKGHRFGEATEKIYATCTTDGMESYKTCERCKLFFLSTEDNKSTEGKNNTASFVIPALDHDYDEGVVTTNPTCTEDGVKTFTCQNDKSHTYTEPVEATGHVFGEIVNKVEADCTTDGHEAYKECTVCHKFFGSEEDNFSENEKDSPDDFIIEHEGHKEGAPVQENIQASDCVTNAKYDNVWYCTKCKTKLRTEHVEGEPLGHKFDKQVIDADHLKTAATCNSYAVYYYECSRANCGTIANTAEYNLTFQYTEGGYDYTNHSTTETELVDNKAATCCETGYTGDLICVACKKVVKEGSAIATNNDHSAYKQTVTSKTTVEANCKTAEKWIETTTCEGCKKVTKTEEKTGSKNALKHTGNTKDVTTVTAEGTCCSIEKFKTETICLDCERVISTKTGEGGYNVGNHSGGTYTGTANLVVATCKIARSWDEVTFCGGCDTELDREKITLSVDPENHVGETYTADKDIKDATCKTVKTWNEVTYCADCKREISQVSKTGEVNPENHSGTTVRLNEKEATCKEDGYEGDLYWECCNTLHTEGNVIPKHNNHTPGEPVKENEIPATETTDGQYDSVVYCTVCGTEISRETIVYHIERTITFVLKDSKVEVKAFKGDIVTPPETPEVISADGFYHLFMHWDKKIKPVTGDETYTAIYTEPCDYTELDRLEGVLNEIVNGGVVDSQVLAIYKEDIDAAFAAIKEVNKERRFRDISEQNAVTVVTDMLEELVYTIYPDYGSTLVIEASSVLYTGRMLDIKAVKMPAGNVINDAEWTSSDEDIAFFSNGKLYAIGTGTVTITAERGKLKASKVITVIEGGNTRGINFTALETVEFIIEDYYTANNTSVIYWTDDQPIRFRVNLTQAGLFDYYTVYINGVPAEMSRDGYYIIPANYGDARVTIIGEVENDNDGNSGTTAVSKWSFWEWILSFFRKIGDFFRGLFG